MTNDEMLEIARQAKSADELLALAKDNNIVLNADEAAEYFAKLHKTGELSDEELDNVAGGGCDPDPCPYCGSKAGTSIDNNTKIWIDAVRYCYPIRCVTCHAQVDKTRILSEPMPGMR